MQSAGMYVASFYASDCTYQYVSEQKQWTWLHLSCAKGHENVRALQLVSAAESDQDPS